MTKEVLMQEVKRVADLLKVDYSKLSDAELYSIVTGVTVVSFDEITEDRLAFLYKLIPTGAFVNAAEDTEDDSEDTEEDTTTDAPVVDDTTSDVPVVDDEDGNDETTTEPEDEPVVTPEDEPEVEPETEPVVTPEDEGKSEAIVEE